MKKLEASFTVLFRHYLKAHPMDSACFELKQTTTDSLAFSAVKEHQINALLAAKSKSGFLYKISDESRGVKPFDMFYMNQAYAYVVIKYPKFFCLIDVDDFVKENKESKRRSLTSKQAKEIAVKVVDINRVHK
jgi:hypothetical protein